MPRETLRLLKNVPVANSGMARTQLKHMLCYFMVLFSANIVAAGNTLIPNDSNSRITVENAVVDGNETTVFFFTWPDMGDPNSGKSCPLNYYSVKLKPGLPSANADVVAKGVCGGLFQKSRLLDSGDALIIVHDRLERWRRGEKIKSQTFSSIDAVSKLGVTTDMMGGQFYDFSLSGDVVLLIQSGDHTYDRKEYAGSLMVMTGMKPDGRRRWEERFVKDSLATTAHSVWAATDGGALMHMTKFKQSAGSLVGVEEEQLLFISADGSKELFMLTEPDKPFAFNDMNNVSKEDMAKFYEHQRNAKPESLKKVEAIARKGGGFDVLFHRVGGEEGREGFFLYRIGPDGSLLSEISLGNQITEHGLGRWFDFYVDGEQLVLLSSAAVTQKVVRKVKKKWGQNIVSWIDLDTGIPTPRMIPLDERYLEAALNAGDAGQQYLDGQPGSEPELLATLGGKPLVVSIGWISHRQVLRLNEADEQLLAYTETYDEKQAKLAKEESRKQRKANREASKQRMNADMAAAVEMTPEEYAALSNKERKEAMVRSGDMDAMMAAMAEMQAKMANDPNMTPEMRAQMSAMMAQMGQSPGGQVTGTPGLPGAQPPVAPARNNTSEAVLPENTLKVDFGKRGFLEYENKDGRLVTLLIFNRQTEEELLKKDYPDGVIYEYVDFSRFNLPLQHIGVNYKDVDSLVLKDLTPVVAQ